MTPLLHSAEATLHALRALALPAGSALETDSRRIVAGDVFVAWPGVARDPRRYLGDAFAHGAAAAVIDAAGSEPWSEDPRVLRVQGLQRLAGTLASAWWGHPSHRVRVLAVTGTNGKTSCALWLARALGRSGRPCGVIGTLGVGMPDALTMTGLTTPDPVRVQRELATMLARGVEYCAIEASSIGIEEQRLQGVRLYAAAFTNLTQDHLDYHGDMASYAAAKRKLFDHDGLQWAVLNRDDAFAVELARHASQRGLQVLGCSGTGSADWQVTQLQQLASSMRMQLVAGADRAPLELPLLGAFNAANVVLVAAMLQACGLGFDAVIDALSAIVAPPGRMQGLGGRAAPLLVVDYAHTPDALQQALAALKPVAAARGGRVWCVFGAGGDRDRSKRGAMAAVAERAADIVVLTSDNPRSEAPQTILDDLQGGLQRPQAAIVLADRAAAIAQTVAHADATDVVLLAGKGHEATQEAAGRKRPFNDVFHARAALAARGAGAFDLRELQGWVGGELHGDPATPLGEISTDTRTLRPGSLFVALRGERFDANTLLAQAHDAGAGAVLAESGVAACGLPGIEVDSSLHALGRLARAWRRQQPALPLIAVTGSNGKTTVTQMLAHILAAWQGDHQRLATAGNFNNEVGLPLTLLRLRPEHLAGVVELGMNHPGEVARLAAIAEPQVALVNNAQREHQEFMSSVEAVARENGAVLQALPDDGWAVYPADDDYTPLWRELAGARPQLRFALHEPGCGAARAAEVSATCSSTDTGMQLQLRTPHGEARVTLQLVGLHNARNALAATACALAAGAPLDAVVRGLEAFSPVRGRMQRQLLQRVDGSALQLIDDSYNANPDSVRAAIDALAAMPGRRLLVLGDMGEVGTQGPAFHAEVGQHAAASGIDALWCVGTLSAHAASAAASIARHADRLEQLDLSAAALRGFDTILVKGSRFMRMERALETIKESMHAA